MKAFFLAATSLASVALAGTEDIRSLIQSKLSLDVESSQDAIICAGESLYCPISPIPNKVFDPEGGVAGSLAGSCCPAKYTQCQVQDKKAYCRGLLTYTIPEATGESQELCPSTTPNCTCQKFLSGEKFLRLNFCPSTTPCCPICECHGDPHCRSFDGDNAIWATCDDRDTNCVHSAPTCMSTTYGGQPCRWIGQKPGQMAYCARADGTSVPTMTMYKKTYKKYFDPADNKFYDYSLQLSLGTYGSIIKIVMTDTAKSASPFVWEITPAGNCLDNPTYPFNSKGVAHVTGLPSGVDMTLHCITGGGRSPTSSRFDIEFVEDPWFGGDRPPGDTFGGFCASGVITESIGEQGKGGCNNVDRQLTKYFGCHPNSNVNTCKTNWCNDNYFKLDYAAFAAPGTFTSVAQKKKACSVFVNNGGNPKAFLQTVCATSPAYAGGTYPQDPTTCESEVQCKTCMDNIMDFPDEIATILADKAPSLPPKKNCNPNLLAVGLNRKVLGLSQSGVQIDYSLNGVWTPIFALFDIELAQCDCKAIIANGTIPANQVLMKPGNYRIKQCNGLNTSPTQEMCVSSPAYNTTVTYINPFDGAAISTPYGELVEQNKLICNKAKYPGCAPDYDCCVWESSKGGWEACMVSAYGINYANKYPNCKFPDVPPS
jgi:hypothetical protein